ncbi:hypothetical protein RND81_08G177300 [Saponaria officinalis]|uniref:DUF7653 domain-containing protein n=1 Tax=Saponaria officinalis TaxID=3572 RepID=A0AAW1J7Z7_SAPOF
MKKLFFFRNFGDKQTSAGNSPSSDQHNIKDEHFSGSHRFPLYKHQHQDSENQTLDPGACLRRSRSFSAAAFTGNATPQRNVSCLSERSSSPCSSSSSVNAQQQIRSSRCRTLTPERHVKTKRSTRASVENDFVARKPPSSRSSRLYHGRSENSSLSSSNVSNEVLDLYIDGEQHYERGSPVRKAASKDHAKHGGGKKPPRIHCTAPASSTGSIKDNPIPHAFRGARGLEPHPSTGDWIENGFSRESPKELAKHVVEKLCQTHSHFDSDVPITIEDVYGRPLDENESLKSDSAFFKGFEPENDRILTDGVSEDDLDMDLKLKFQKVKEMILFLSEELNRDSFLRDTEFNVPALVRRVKELTEEKISMALELSAALESRLADRASMKEQIRSLSVELESTSWKLQNESNDFQSAMEKELDKRSHDWSLKVETFQAEELRLRERVRELAEQNVSLQREVSSLSEMRTDMHNTEKQVDDLTAMLDATRGENQELRQGICELQDKYKVADEDRVCVQRSFREKEEECKDLHARVTRLLRTCSEQEKTIDGLRGELTESLQKNRLMDNSDRRVQKLQLEQIRLTGVEQSLRKEIESYKPEVDSLRHENINLLNRLRAGGEVGGLLTFKLDEELRGRLDLLQKQGLSLLNENIRLCSKLLESLKRVSRNVGKESTEVDRSCLDAQFIMESDLKVQGLRRGTESLMRGLQNVSTVMREKTDLSFPNSQTKIMDGHEICLQNGSNLQDLLRSELKAEMLLTSLLREKLYATSQEVEQLQAEVAAAARGKDVLKCEVDNALDSLSAVTHRMKEVELQMMKKEEKIHQLQSDLQESTKQLTLTRGILPKVTEERDMIWEEVKQHSEQNMLLTSEVNLLKKKIDRLEEELLLKEGEITILRDASGSKSFDLLASPVRTREFLLE